MTGNNTELDDQLHWYKDAIIYELHIKAFKDATGDGIGDFGGLIDKLDYLQNLGITAIWLLPFYPSPLRDDGYDIADYYSINPAYGTIEQFQTFIDAAHKRNLKVITELVINHTSDQHPWFQRARTAPKGSPERDYYVWTDDPQQFRDARIIFQDFESSNWTWDAVAGQYFWHRFYHHQPDLNYDNPAVQAEVFKILEYWCAMGVDGFRLDAVPYLYERDGTNCENLPETHVFLKKLRAHVDSKFPGTLLLAEANMWPEDSASYFGDGDECQMNYHFPIMPRMFMSVQMEERYPIVDIIEQTPEIPENCQWGIFLRNHDELTLEMVTDEERDYMYKMYVKDPRARINLGIRHRLAPLMDNNRRKIELMNFLLFSLPGTPIIYYGDEIGMGDNYYLGDRNGVRTPMQWSGERNAGFSAANPQSLYLPVILDPLYHYESVNVEIQHRNTSSLLWAIRRMISTRKKHRAFSRGKMQMIDTENPKILAFTRQWQDEVILVIVNLSRFPQPAELDLRQFSGSVVKDVFSGNVFPTVKNDDYLFTLAPHECSWYLLSGQSADGGRQLSDPEMKFDWNEMLKGHFPAELLQNDLPEWLACMRWFGGKGNTIHYFAIAEQATLQYNDHQFIMSLIEVGYTSGMPELYQVSLGFSSDERMLDSLKQYPNAVLCKAIYNGKEGIVFDALYSSVYREMLLVNTLEDKKLTIGSGNLLQFTATESIKKAVAGNIPESKIHSAEQSNSSVSYGGKYFLKIYRKVDIAVNPDLEIIRFLSEKNFPYIPNYAGMVTWATPSGPVVLAMMQEMVAGNVDGWSYMLDKLTEFHERVLSDKSDELLHYPVVSILPGQDVYDKLPERMKALLDAAVLARVQMLGERTAAMHLALGSENQDEDFTPEKFTLHYQRSLFSAFQSLASRTWHSLEKNLYKIPENAKAEAGEILGMKKIVLDSFKSIYRKKVDGLKIRIHGDFHLGQALFTAKDIVLIDFEGEPAKAYSERRIKRSPLRDVAGMLRSFHYAAYGSLFLHNNTRQEDIEQLIPYVEQWQNIMSAIFVDAYLAKMNGSMLIPAGQEDIILLLKAYVLEKAVYELDYELNNRPEWVIIPMRGIQSIIGKKQ